jgi:hypothetical protein
MAKNKKFALNTISFSFHPLLQEVLATDHFDQKKQGNISCLAIEELQFILDSRPISVCTTKHSDTFLLLDFNPLLQIFRDHPRAHKLKVTLIICDADDANRIITSLNIKRLALEYPTSRRSPELLFKRHQQAIKMGLTSFTKKELSAFAQVCPSALRASKRGARYE